MSRFEVLADQVAAVLDVDEAIIDGEVIVVDETGRPHSTEGVADRPLTIGSFC